MDTLSDFVLGLFDLCMFVLVRPLIPLSLFPLLSVLLWLLGFVDLV